MCVHVHCWHLVMSSDSWLVCSLLLRTAYRGLHTHGKVALEVAQHQHSAFHDNVYFWCSRSACSIARHVRTLIYVTLLIYDLSTVGSCQVLTCIQRGQGTWGKSHLPRLRFECTATMAVQE
jgi:hypothetical protein